MQFSNMSVIIGPNDAGKSSILHALAIFFEKRMGEKSDFHLEAGQDESIEIEVEFSEIDDNTRLQLKEKRLISSSENLIIKKSFDQNFKPKSVLVKAYDFVDPDFQNLWSKKETELNKLGQKYGLDFKKAGRSITNKSKIEELVNYAESQQYAKDDVWIEPDKDILDELQSSLPAFIIFPSELSLDTGQSVFQNPFQQMIMEAVEIDQSLKENVEEIVRKAVSQAIEAIKTNLMEQTDSVTQLIPKPVFEWKKLVRLDIEIIDQFGIKTHLVNRGLGVRRLFMVAFLKYVAERNINHKTCIYAIEEPETFLHPKAQRVLIDAFRKVVEKGNQIIITTHSPVFAAEVGQEDIILVSRGQTQSNIRQGTQVRPEDIVEELGILPRDDIAGYAACMFVEGPADKVFFETISKTLYDAGKISGNLSDKKIGIVPVAGDNLKFFVEKELILKRLNRCFAVIVDGDKKDQTRISQWKQKCEEEGGKFFILRKRSIENYLHPVAFKRILNKSITVEEFNNVKEQIPDYDWNKHLKPVVEGMSADEILEMDRYDDGAGEKHELVDILESILQLPKG